MAWILLFPTMTAWCSRLGQSRVLPAQSQRPTISLRRSIMSWSKPEFIDWRFGFEITLYIANR
jgi:coenzyme PQQ precursor peptide PqqA